MRDPSRLAALCCTLLLCSASPLRAQTWDGETSTDVLVGTNWNGDVTPGPANDAVSDDGGTTNQPELFSGDTLVVRRWDHSAGTLTISGSMTTQMFLSGTGTLLIGRTGVLDGSLQQSGGLLRGDGLVLGNWTLGSAGRFDGTGDLLIDGAATLQGGGLLLDLTDLIIDTDVVNVDVFSAQSISGDFGNFSLTGLPSNYRFQSQVIATPTGAATYQLQLTRGNSVPVVGTLALVALGFMALGLTHRRAR